MRLHFKIGWLSVSIGGKHIEENIAERGGGWDGLELGKWYKVFVVKVPSKGELTREGRPMRPISRLKNKDGSFIGRYIVTEVDKPVKLGQELVVLITTVSNNFVFATTEDNGTRIMIDNLRLGEFGW